MTTAKAFCERLYQAVRENWGYVWSLEGQVYTAKMAQQFVNEKRSTPSGHTLKGYWQGTSWAARWYGKRCADCSGLITWALKELGAIQKRYNSSGFINACTKRGYVKDGVPQEDGIVLWKPGHIAVLYQGKVLEAKSTKIGVVFGKTPISDFTQWGYLPWLEYESKKEVVSVYYAKTTGNVNLREKPTTSSKALRVIPKNTPLIAQSSKDGWSLVSGIIDSTPYNGYISAQYIQKV